MSQPRRRSNSLRPAHRPEKLAIVVPDTKPTAVSSGKSSNETIQSSQISSRHDVMRSVLVPNVGHPSGGEPHRKSSAVHETKVSAARLIDDSGRADLLKL